MARRATDWDGPNRDYECVVDPLPSGRFRWQATHKGEVLANGESKWRWRAASRAENACREHLYRLAAARAIRAHGEHAAWHPHL